VVNLVHSDGKEHYPVDYRIYDLCPRGVQHRRLNWIALGLGLILVDSESPIRIKKIVGLINA